FSMVANLRRVRQICGPRWNENGDCDRRGKALMSGRKPPSSRRGRQASKVNGNGRGAAYSESRIAGRVGELGKEISRAYRGRRLDVVITLDRGFVFAADLIRARDGTVGCPFVREAL